MYLGRLFWKKGIQYFPDLANAIADIDGYFICAGKLDECFHNDNIIHINEKLSVIDSLNFLAAADFYIACSVQEMGPLMPRHACSYGAIPVVTQIIGMKKLFNEKNSIIFNSKNPKETITQCKTLYDDKEKLL